MLPRQLICESLFSTCGRSQSTESARPRREKRMFGRVGSSRHSAVLRAQRNGGVVVQRGVANPFCSVPVVDFTRAFRMNRDLKDINNLVRCERQFLEKLKTLDGDQLAKKTKGYLNKEEIKGLMARRDKIVARFEQLVREKGEPAVLY